MMFIRTALREFIRRRGLYARVTNLFSLLSCNNLTAVCYLTTFFRDLFTLQVTTIIQIDCF